MSTSLDPRAMRVALIAGGTSSEREISIASGAGARAALEQAGFTVETIDPANAADLHRLLDEKFDVAFLALHGKPGEDGTIQGFLEIAGIPYTCPGVWSSATAMDKPLAKVFYEREGLPTPPSIVVRRGDDVSVPGIIDSLGDHVVVKIGDAGSAIGVFIVQGADAIEQALSKAFAMDDEVLIERYVKGRELTVAVLGNAEPDALPIIEIVPKSDFYDYESKYAPGGSKHLCPAPLDSDLTSEIQSYAVRAHTCLRCEGVSRSDFILDADGTPWILETNTIPGMTETSLLPDAAREFGLSFPELCTRLIELALEKK